MPPRVSALIVSYNTCELTLAAIASVADEPGVEVVLVDNASHDGSADAIAAQFPELALIRSNRNLGFAGGVNLAASRATGDYLLVLNSDARLVPGALQVMLSSMEAHLRAALIGPSLVYPDGQRQDAAFRFPGLVQIALDLKPVPRLMGSWINGRVHAALPVQIDHPLGACMLIRHSAWLDVGPLDEGYFMYLEEIDWCRRAQLHGWQVWYEPRAVCVHHGGSSTRQQPEDMFAQLWRSRLRYYARHHGPLYNRVVHALVRRGLPRRGAPVETVRDLLK